MQARLSMLTALERDCFAHPYSTQQIESLLGDPAYLVLTIEPDGEVETIVTGGSHPVGYLIAYENHAEGLSELHRVAVLPEFRQRGLAHRLLSEWVMRSGGRRLMLDVAAKNTAAIALYRRHGFVMIANRKRYYSDGDDALILERAP